MLISNVRIIDELRVYSSQTLPMPSDTQFYAPDIRWARTFGDYLRTNRDSLYPNYDRKKAQKGDCDDLAIIANGRAHEAWLRSSVSVDAGLAMFRARVHVKLGQSLFGFQEGPAYHDVLLFRDENTWNILEPYVGEIASVDSLRAAGIVGDIVRVDL